MMATVAVMPDLFGREPVTGKVMSVLGPVDPASLGVTLVHEHVMADFIGADQTGPHRYNIDEVVKVVLPHLQKLKDAGCRTFVECTATFLGRDAGLAKRLAYESGMIFITNTGNYAALGGKFLPPYVHSETARQLAARWIGEANHGIDTTGVRPGIIKIGVDAGPLPDVGRKLVEAAAIAHLSTGLSISGHTGDGHAAMEEVAILLASKVDPAAFRWVHAQNEKDKRFHLKAANEGAYVEFDGIRPDSVDWHVECVLAMKENGFLHRTLVSQDAGWYSVGEPGGGDFTPYTIIFEQFIPALRKAGITQHDIDQLLVTNPKESLTIQVRKK